MRIRPGNNSERRILQPGIFVPAEYSQPKLGGLHDAKQSF